MSDSSFSSGTPQFSTAEYASKGGADRCKSCNQPIGGTYYRVNGALACPTCAQRVAGSLPKDSHAAFVRGVTFGVGGAILGLAIYAIFEILTGIIIGYVALAVGYIVARAIKTGSHGIGGRRYQIAAAALTYAAVSLAAIPVGITQYVKARDARAAAHQRQLQRQNDVDAFYAPEAGNPPPPAASPAPAHHMSFSSVAGRLLLAGLASPFLDLNQTPFAFIGLVILFVGIRIAWRMTADSGAVGVIGPFRA
jgi:hypothetical protein